MSSRLSPSGVTASCFRLTLWINVESAREMAAAAAESRGTFAAGRQLWVNLHLCLPDILEDTGHCSSFTKISAHFSLKTFDSLLLPLSSPFFLFLYHSLIRQTFTPPLCSSSHTSDPNIICKHCKRVKLMETVSPWQQEEAEAWSLHSSCYCLIMCWQMSVSTQGYSFITQIPEGSWDIQIIERKKSADVLGMHRLLPFPPSPWKLKKETIF